MPVTDVKIASLTFLDLQWYACMLEQDMQEAYNKTIDYIEYLAAFSNPSNVEAMRKERDSAKEKTQQDPTIFNQILEKMFGRELPKEE